MPARYEAIRDSMVAKGKSLKAAKTSAAKIFNATRTKGEAPVTGKAEVKTPRGVGKSGAAVGGRRGRG